jgi:hypothetical protein
MYALPRGLIRTLSQEELWEETRNVQLDLREYKTSEFWEDILHDVFIKQDDGYYVNSQQPPDDQSTNYCDFIVSTKTRQGKKARLIVVEAKRLKVYVSSTQVEAMETQLKNYCVETIQNVPEADVPFIYGLAVVGTRGRMFSFDKERGLVTFSNGFAEGSGENRDGYRDAQEDIWNETFRLVKRFPPSGALAHEG